MEKDTSVLFQHFVEDRKTKKKKYEEGVCVCVKSGD